VKQPLPEAWENKRAVCIVMLSVLRTVKHIETESTRVSVDMPALTNTDYSEQSTCYVML